MRNCRSKKYRRGHLSTQCATSATPMNVPPPVDVIPLRAENQRDDSENVNSFRGGSTFSTWLYRVAVNTVLMKLRGKSPPVLSLDEPVSRDSPSLKREIEKEDLNPLNLRGAIDRIASRHAVEELPRVCRQMFHLHEVEGYGTAHPLCLEVYPIANYGSVDIGVHPFPPSGTREHRACRRGEVHSTLAKHKDV
jgi:hypothetical protein